MPDNVETLEKLIESHKGDKGSVISILQELQEEFGYISEDAVNYVADRLWIPRSKFYGAATFYAQFYLHPRGKNVVTACCGTACHVKGSERLINAVARELKLGEGQDTTSDGQFTLERVNCVGACSIAPVVIINKKVYGKSTTDKILKEIKGLGGSQKEDAEDED